MSFSKVNQRMTRAARMPWRLFWYFAPTGLNGIVAVGSIPILILAIGEFRWAQVALGQSIGLIGAVVISLGWPVTGPAEIARSDAESRYGILVRSLIARLLLILPVAFCMLGAAAIIPGAWNWLFLWTSAASALLGLASSWFYLGLDRPIALFVIDALTRGLSVCGGLALALLYKDGIFYPGGLAFGLVLSVVFTILYARKGATPAKCGFDLRSILITLRSQREGLGFNVMYVILCSLALPLTSFVGNQAFILFAVIDKVQKQFVTIMLPIAQIVVGRMSRNLASGFDTGVSANKSLRQIYISGLLIFGFSIICGPLVTNILSVGTVRMDFFTGLAFSVLVALAFMTQSIPVAVLAPLNRLRYAIVGSLAGICVMVPGVLWFGQELSILGILISVDFAYGSCLIFLLVSAGSSQSVLRKSKTQ